ALLEGAAILAEQGVLGIHLLPPFAAGRTNGERAGEPPLSHRYPRPQLGPRCPPLEGSTAAANAIRSRASGKCARDARRRCARSCRARMRSACWSGPRPRASPLAPLSRSGPVTRAVAR